MARYVIFIISESRIAPKFCWSMEHGSCWRYTDPNTDTAITTSGLSAVWCGICSGRNERAVPLLQQGPACRGRRWRWPPDGEPVRRGVRLGAACPLSWSSHVQNDAKESVIPSSVSELWAMHLFCHHGCFKHGNRYRTMFTARTASQFGPLQQILDKADVTTNFCGQIEPIQTWSTRQVLSESILRQLRVIESRSRARCTLVTLPSHDLGSLP